MDALFHYLGTYFSHQLWRVSITPDEKLCYGYHVTLPLEKNLVEELLQTIVYLQVNCFRTARALADVFRLYKRSIRKKFHPIVLQLLICLLLSGKIPNSWSGFPNSLSSTIRGPCKSEDRYHATNVIDVAVCDLPCSHIYVWLVNPLQHGSICVRKSVTVLTCRLFRPLDHQTAMIVVPIFYHTSLHARSVQAELA